MPSITTRPPTAAGSSPYATVAELAAHAHVPKPPTIITLIAGQDDETYTLTSCTTAEDATYYKVGVKGLQVSMVGDVTGQVRVDPVGPTDPLTHPPAAVVGLWVYVPEPAKLTQITVDVYTDEDLTTAKRWERAATSFTTGWNLFRWGVIGGFSDPSSVGTVYRVRVLINVAETTNVTIGHLFMECPPKAQVLIINDGCFKNFATIGVPDLRELGIPVTWAVSPMNLETGEDVGTINERLTEADLEVMAAAGDSISFHSWDTSPLTADMTADQVVEDTVKCVRWLQQRGYEGRMWRAAWRQNEAPQAAAARPFVLAYATADSDAAASTWPPIDRWDIARTGIHGRTVEEVDDVFTKQALTHNLFVWYTHGIDDTNDTDTDPEDWDYFVSKLRDGIDGGWLEGVTFEQLFARSGGRFVQGFGDAQVEYMDETGTLVRRTLI